MRQGNTKNVNFMQKKCKTLIGRENLVSSIQKNIAAGESVLLYGGPGEGKTSLAIAVAMHVHEIRSGAGATFLVDWRGT